MAETNTKLSNEEYGLISQLRKKTRKSTAEVVIDILKLNAPEEEEEEEEEEKKTC